MLNIIFCKYLHAPFQNHPPLTDSKLPHQINSKTSEMLRSLVANSIGCYTGYTVVLDAQAVSLYDGCILMYPWCTCFFCRGLVDVYSMHKNDKVCRYGTIILRCIDYPMKTYEKLSPCEADPIAALFWLHILEFFLFNVNLDESSWPSPIFFPEAEVPVAGVVGGRSSFFHFRWGQWQS